MPQRDSLNKLDGDLGKLHTFVADYIKQLIGNNEQGTQFKETLDRLIIPYSDTQLDLLKDAFEADVREPRTAYWILKLLTQRAAPLNQDIQDELNILNQMLYTPGRIIPHLNQDIIVINQFNITSLTALLSKIYLIRHLTEKYTAIETYIENNPNDIDQHYPELRQLTLGWLNNEYAQIRRIALNPHQHVVATNGQAIPRAKKAIPELKNPAPPEELGNEDPVAHAPMAVPVPEPIAAPVAAPLAPPIAPYRPFYLVAPAPVPVVPAAPADPAAPLLTGWHAFRHWNDTTRWYERFSFYRLFQNEYFDVSNGASAPSFLFLNIIFWMQIPLMWDILKNIAQSSIEALKNNTRYALGFDRFLSIFNNAMFSALAVAKILFSPLLLALPLLMGLTSLPIILFNEIVQRLRLPEIVTSVISLALRIIDVTKDLALIISGIYAYSNFLSSFAIGGQLLANAGLGALMPFFASPFGALTLAMIGTLLLVPTVSFVMLSSIRLCTKTLELLMSGASRIFRYDHSPQREVVNLERADRLRDLLGARHDVRQDIVRRREFRSSPKQVRPIEVERDRDEIRPHHRPRRR